MNDEHWDENEPLPRAAQMNDEHWDENEPLPRDPWLLLTPWFFGAGLLAFILAWKAWLIILDLRCR